MIIQVIKLLDDDMGFVEQDPTFIKNNSSLSISTSQLPKKRGFIASNPLSTAPPEHPPSSTAPPPPQKEKAPMFYHPTPPAKR
jgi:hypothetical protein